MDNLAILEEFYKKYVKDINHWIHDGVIDVDLKLLNDLNLLHYFTPKVNDDEDYSRYFHVFESPEKITLINDYFVVWIVPYVLEGIAKTFALVAINDEQEIKLELAFSVSGIYNTSWLVLRVLEKFLKEIKENEELVNKYK